MQRNVEAQTHAKPQCTCVVYSGILLMVSIRVLERVGGEYTTRLAGEKEACMLPLPHLPNKKKISEGNLARVKRLGRRFDAGEKKKGWGGVKPGEMER